MPCSFFLRLWMLFVIINAYITLQNPRVGTLRFHLNHLWCGNEGLFTLVAITTKDISSVLKVLPNYIDIPRPFFQQANQASLCFIFQLKSQKLKFKCSIVFPPQKKLQVILYYFLKDFFFCFVYRFTLSSMKSSFYRYEWTRLPFSFLWFWKCLAPILFILHVFILQITFWVLRLRGGSKTHRRFCWLWSDNI